MTGGWERHRCPWCDLYQDVPAARVESDWNSQTGTIVMRLRVTAPAELYQHMVRDHPSLYIAAYLAQHQQESPSCPTVPP